MISGNHMFPRNPYIERELPPSHPPQHHLLHILSPPPLHMDKHNVFLSIYMRRTSITKSLHTLNSGLEVQAEKDVKVHTLPPKVKKHTYMYPDARFSCTYVLCELPHVPASARAGYRERRTCANDNLFYMYEQLRAPGLRVGGR